MAIISGDPEWLLVKSCWFYVWVTGGRPLTVAFRRRTWRRSCMLLLASTSVNFMYICWWVLMKFVCWPVFMYSIPKCICFYSFDSQVIIRFVGTVNLWAGTPHLSHIACLKVDDESLTWMIFCHKFPCMQEAEAQQSADEWYENTLNSLKKMSPISLKVTLRSVSSPLVVIDCCSLKAWQVVCSWNDPLIPWKCGCKGNMARSRAFCHFQIISEFSLEVLHLVSLFPSFLRQVFLVLFLFVFFLLDFLCF